MWHYLQVLIIVLVFRASVQISSPPQIIKQPPSLDNILFQVSDYEQEIEKPFVLECEAEGEPEPDYWWTKNGRPFNWQVYDDRISQQPGRGTLVISVPRDEDQGMYQCFAENTNGIATSNSVWVQKATLESFADESIQTVDAVEGSPFRLDCNAPEGYPKPNIHWFIQNMDGSVHAINNSRITKDPDNNLWFSFITTEDASENFYYTCFANSNIFEEYKSGNRFLLNVMPSILDRRAPMRQYVSNSYEVAQQDKQFELFCIFGGYPIPQIRWKKNGRPIAFDDRVRENNYGKSLYIRKIVSDDAGKYACEASNGVGRGESYSFDVQIETAPYFTVEPEIINATTDETVTFHCEASGNPEVIIQWIYNGKLIEEAPRNYRRTVNINRIIIQGTLKEDTGNYGCNASNSVGYVYKDAYLNILDLAPGNIEPSFQVTGNYYTAILSCPAVITHLSSSVNWIKDNEELIGDRFRTLENGDLEISDVQFSDAGDYICKVANRTDLAASASLIVVSSENVVILDCNIDASSSDSNIDWYKNNEFIHLEDDSRFIISENNSLFISTVTEMDSGLYSCVYSSYSDKAQSNVTLVVRDELSAPILTNVDCSKNYATISWIATGNNPFPIFDYTIQYNTSLDPKKWIVATNNIPPWETSYTMPMNPGTEYAFRAITNYANRLSLPSLPSKICSTQLQVPKKHPDNVECINYDQNNYIIKWTAMPPDEHNAPGFHYIVFWQEEHPENNYLNQKSIYDWDQTELIFMKSSPNSKYVVKVIAENDDGEADVSKTEIRCSPPDEQKSEKIIQAPADRNRDNLPPQITKQSPSDIFIQEIGNPIELECYSDTKPGPIYKWYKDGELFDWQIYSSRMTQQQGGTIMIMETINEDLGRYQCFVENELGLAISNLIHVQTVAVEEPIKIVKVNEGDPLVLDCNVANHQNDRQWILINSLGDVTKPNVIEDHEGNLVFSSVERTDASYGFYYACVTTSDISSPDFKIYKRVFIHVVPNQQDEFEPEQLFVSNANEIGHRGKSIKLYCIFDGTPMPEIIWTKNGKTIPWSSRIVTGNDGKILIIEKVIWDDAGIYTCDVSNGLGNSQSHSIDLKVQISPYFTIEPEVISATEGESVTFRCETFGVPEPIIEWIHNGDPIEAIPPNERRTVHPNSLTIQEVTKEDTGNYGCNATNSLGYVYKDVYLSVLTE